MQNVLISKIQELEDKLVEYKYENQNLRIDQLEASNKLNIFSESLATGKKIIQKRKIIENQINQEEEIQKKYVLSFINNFSSLSVENQEKILSIVNKKETEEAVGELARIIEFLLREKVILPFLQYLEKNEILDILRVDDFIIRNYKNNSISLANCFQILDNMINKKKKHAAAQQEFYQIFTTNYREIELIITDWNQIKEIRNSYMHLKNSPILNSSAYNILFETELKAIQLLLNIEFKYLQH